MNNMIFLPSKENANMPEMSRNVYLNISTYSDLEKEGEKVVWFAERAQALISERLATQANRTIIYSQPVKGRRNRRFLFNEKNWGRLRQEIQEGKLKYFKLATEFNREDDPVPWLAEITMNIWPKLRPDEPGTASTIDLGIRRYLYGPQPATEWQVDWVELGCEAFLLLPGANGFLTTDYFTPGDLFTPHESLFRITWKVLGSSLRSNLRGYFWGNWLSQTHISRLGGIESIKHNSPCYLVRELPKSDDNMVYLQLTPDLDNFNDNELLALRNYLHNLISLGDLYPLNSVPGSLEPRLVD